MRWPENRESGSIIECKEARSVSGFDQRVEKWRRWRVWRCFVRLPSTWGLQAGTTMPIRSIGRHQQSRCCAQFALLYAHPGVSWGWAARFLLPCFTALLFELTHLHVSPYVYLRRFSDAPPVACDFASAHRVRAARALIAIGERLFGVHQRSDRIGQLQLAARAWAQGTQVIKNARLQNIAPDHAYIRRRFFRRGFFNNAGQIDNIVFPLPAFNDAV